MLPDLIRREINNLYNLSEADQRAILLQKEKIEIDAEKDRPISASFRRNARFVRVNPETDLIEQSDSKDGPWFTVEGNH